MLDVLLTVLCSPLSSLPAIVIGQGAYGVVCSALDKKNGTFAAVKQIQNVFDHRSLAKRTLRELKLVRIFQHENILGIERVMRPHTAAFNNIYLVSELMETDLACVIRSPQELTDEHVQFFIYQCLLSSQPVLMADGSKVAAKAINAGDELVGMGGKIVTVASVQKDLVRDAIWVSCT
jgi:hypothetical protein